MATQTTSQPKRRINPLAVVIPLFVIAWAIGFLAGYTG